MVDQWSLRHTLEGVEGPQLSVDVRFFPLGLLVDEQLPFSDPNLDPLIVLMSVDCSEIGSLEFRLVVSESCLFLVF